MAKYRRPRPPPGGNGQFYQHFQPKGCGPHRQLKASNSIGTGLGRWSAGGKAGELPASQSAQAGICMETDHQGHLGLDAAGSWEGCFCLEKWQFLSHVAPTRITMLITTGTGGLGKYTQGERKEIQLKKKKT